MKKRHFYSIFYYTPNMLNGRFSVMHELKYGFSSEKKAREFCEEKNKKNLNSYHNFWYEEYHFEKKEIRN